MLLLPGMSAFQKRAESKERIPNSESSDLRHLGKEVISGEEIRWKQLSSIPQIAHILFFLPICKKQHSGNILKILHLSPLSTGLSTHSLNLLKFSRHISQCSPIKFLHSTIS